MIRYNHDRDFHSPFLATDNRYFRVFLESNNGGGAGGAPSPGNGAAGSGGATPDVTSQQQQQQQTPGLYDQINWDELPAATRTILEAARADHERLAGANTTLQTERDQERTRALQLQQQLGAPPNQQQQQQQRQEPDPILDGIVNTLRTKGFTQAQIDQQAPILADVMKATLPTFRNMVGQDLAPLAGTVIAHENLGNFTAAQQDNLGSQLLAIPEVAQAVWNIVDQQTKAGKQFGTDAVLNLAKMVYTEHQFAQPNQQQQQQPQPPATSAFFPSMAQPPINRSTAGAFNFPGSNLRPVTNGQQTVTNPAVNEDTRAALAVTFGEMARTTGVAPAAFPSDRASRGAGARAPRQ